MALEKANPAKKAPKWGFGFFEKSHSWMSCALVVGCALSIVYLLQSMVVNRNNCMSFNPLPSIIAESAPSNISSEHKLGSSPPQARINPKGTELSRIVFAIAGAARNWPVRKEYIRIWYNSAKNVRAIMWFDEKVNGTWEKDAPPFRISEDISRFPISRGKLAVTRIARIVSETFRLGLPDVDWFIMGDDDTFFFPGNVAKVLAKYDPTRMWYIGSNSESQSQDVSHSFNMAFGGGGFAISYVLAEALAKMQDSCLLRYSRLWGSDERVYACMSELGVSLTHELGFHQMDIVGNAMGLLAAHPQAPLVSLHHIDWIDPIFPNFNRHKSLHHLLQAAKVESSSLFQQSICYADGQNWSISVSWGYVVQAYKWFVPPRELESPLLTFRTIKRRSDRSEFRLNVREIPNDLCLLPTLYYMQSVTGPSNQTEGLLESVYMREVNPKRAACDKRMHPLNLVQRIRVLKEPVADSWFQAPRRSCCSVKAWGNDTVELRLLACREGETLTSNLH